MLLPALIWASRHHHHFAGADGALLIGRRGGIPFPALRVDVVDTTGAGDAFVGGLLFTLPAQIAGIIPYWRRPS